ncbi:unnamed protein product [Cylindrotheca closterium]|uniref:DUF6824 domain-containing protein n=1 Tax=Cylindrotheca closterium TaxID=2856 RepID=A0AAD2CRX7_9STRA|nr:unnamed protein product [Cylindrotheca closterium]
MEDPMTATDISPSDGIPTIDPSPDSVDALLSTELYELSLIERDQVLEDIHGIRAEVTETPELIASSLEKLEGEIKQIRSKSEYDYAYAIDPQYMRKPEFRLRFLKATSFDAKAAANKIVNHFALKTELFGKDKVARDISQDDLDKKDLECLLCGYQQVLPVRDRAGRGVFLFLPYLKTDLDIKHKLRSLFYSMMVHLEDEEIQKKGVVSIVYLVGSQIDRQAAWAEPRLMSIMPMRECAVHICYDNVLLSPIVALARFAVGTLTRLRMRTNFGPFQDCVDGLMTYGIPTYALPFDEDGKASNEDHKIYWEKRRQHERRTTRGAKFIAFPGPNDVLVGRGKLCQNHIGSVRYRSLVEKYKDRYDRSSNFDKTAIAFMIIKIVKESTGRFLKEDSEGWIEVDDNKARAKTSHLFRTLRYSQSARAMSN